MDQIIQTEETTSFPESIHSEGVVYKDKIWLIEKIVANFKGFKKEYFVANSGERAGVLVVYDDHVLLVRQYRLLLNDLSYEIPGGKVDGNESPLLAAIRECHEETGLLLEEAHPLIGFNPTLDCDRNYTHIFYAQPAAVERIPTSENHTWLPFNDCMEMITKGVISDSLTVIALLAYLTKIKLSATEK
ncbi:NUDIX hydrolase [Pseudomonadota bacterium]